MKTMGEMHPTLLLDPRHAWLASREYPYPPIGHVDPPEVVAGFDDGRHEKVKLLILGCDYRGGPAEECGCTKTRICLAGKGRPIPGTDARDVTDRDCRDCVTSRA